MNEARLQKIKQRLTTQLRPTFLAIVDDSEEHSGHAGAQSGAGHYTIEIASELFIDKTPLASHRLVYAALADMIPQEIHAVSIKIRH